MYDLIFTINLLLYASMIYVANTEPNFQFVITQHNRCLETNTLNVIRTFARISVAECITECGTRPECEAINYRRQYKICELISSEIGDLVMTNGQTGPCVLVLKSDISEVQTCSCAVGDVCKNNNCLTKECSLTTQLENVELVGNMNTIGSEILYTCNPGYVNIGQDSAKCLTHGVWSNQPGCVIDCGTPSSVTGASRSYSSTVLDSIVTYACQTGYSHTDGDLQRVCDSDGNWGGMLPTCTVDCGTPSSVTGASSSYSSTVVSSIVTYACQNGFTHTSGDLQRVCGLDGNWGGMLPTCTVDCGTPSSVTGADSSYSSTVVSSIVTYACQNGFTHTSGDLQRVCGSDGNWGGILPTCTVDCGTPSSVTGASRSYSSTVLDSIVTYACQTGYSHTDGDLQRVCDSDGNWGGMLPTCTVDCGTPATTSGASKSYVATTKGSTVTYTCSSGYILIGGDLQRVCSSDGRWSGSLPQCVPGCSELPNVPNSNLSPGGLTQGTQRMVTCTSGNYFATGVTSIVATCLSGGVWSNIDTICPRDSIGANCPGCGILRDCEDVQSLGLKSTGSYLIYPSGNAGINVRCDMDTTSGGWTIIQRRVSSSDFYKTWAEYKNGFGDVESNYWLGNDNIATLTTGGNYKIRFDLHNKNNVHKYAEYSTFKIAGESQKYELTVSGYSGTAGDSLSVHNGQKFSTKDNDNDPTSTTNCAVLYTGAWWYEACHDSNLNGMYGSSESGKGVIWFTISGITESLLKTEMKIKRK